MYWVGCMVLEAYTQEMNLDLNYNEVNYEVVHQVYLKINVWE